MLRAGRGLASGSMALRKGGGGLGARFTAL